MEEGLAVLLGNGGQPCPSEALIATEIWGMGAQPQAPPQPQNIHGVASVHLLSNTESIQLT